MSLFHDLVVRRISGVIATVKRLASMVYWKGMWHSVRNYIRGYVVCQQYKPKNMMAQLFLDHVYKLHGNLATITTNSVVVFLSRF